MFVSVRLGLLPVSGRIDLINYYFDQPTGFMTIDALLSGQQGAFLDALRHLILPAIVLGTVPLAIIARMTRSSMLEVLSEDYVRTARAKGLSQVSVILRHALRNALIPVVTLGALEFGALLSGAVLTEQVFTIPGFGKLIVDAVFNRDYAVVQGVVLCTAFAYIMLNLFADIAYMLINPRLRG
jgi:dipeptide transport system permease protein